jgi:Polyketide cyclase / dehydrase and lipid transport
LRRPRRAATLLAMQITGQAMINASAEDVWSAVAHDFDRVALWASAVPASHEAPDAVPPAGCPVGGRTCQTTMAMFPEVEERIVAYDAVGRTLTYEPVRGMPRFVANARTICRVFAIDQRRARVSFTAIVTTRGIAGSLIAVAMRLQMGRAGARGLDDLRHYVEHGRPSPRKQRQLDRARAAPRRAARSGRAA